jgi:hypothetical protein
LTEYKLDLIKIQAKVSISKSKKILFKTFHTKIIKKTSKQAMKINSKIMKKILKILLNKDKK